MNYEEMKIKHPDWNWHEAEEIDGEDLLAAVELYDMLIKRLTNNK